MIGGLFCVKHAADGVVSTVIGRRVVKKNAIKKERAYDELEPKIMIESNSYFKVLKS